MSHSLVDPQFEGNREKGEGCVGDNGFSFQPVSSLRGEHEFTVSLGLGWKDNLPAFLGFIGVLRGQTQVSRLIRAEILNRFNGFRKIPAFLCKPLKRLATLLSCTNPKLKLGENEILSVRVSNA